MFLFGSEYTVQHIWNFAAEKGGSLHWAALEQQKLNIAISNGDSKDVNHEGRHVARLESCEQHGAPRPRKLIEVLPPHRKYTPCSQ